MTKEEILMAEINGEERVVSGVFGGVQIGENIENAGTVGTVGTVENAGGVFKTVPVNNSNLPATTGGFMTKVKAFLFQEIDWHKEIKVELTPYQQKVEDEINEFLHQEITWAKVKAFLFQDIKFGKKKNN
jgi:hypothetical protein